MTEHSISDLLRLIMELGQQKMQLRHALEAKGAVIPDGTHLEDYPAIISNLCS